MTVQIIRRMSAVLASLVLVGGTQAYTKYNWMPTTGGDIAVIDATGGWGENGACNNYDMYYLQKAQSASLTLANDWTLNGWLNVKTASYIFEFGEGVMSVSKGFNVDQGGNLLLKSGTISSLGGIYVAEGKNAAGGSLTIDHATLTSTGHIYHRTTSENDYDSCLMVTNHATVTITGSSSFFTEGGSEHAQVVIADYSSLSAGSGLQSGRSWNGYLDGGCGGTVTFADHSTGTFGGNSIIGDKVPHSALEILSGSEVSCSEFYVGAAPDSHSNRVTVDGATLNIVTGTLHLGGKSTGGACNSDDNTLCVTNGGTLNVTTEKNDGIAIGNKGSGNRLIVTGTGSAATFVSAKPLYIGKKPDIACAVGTNAVIVTDHAELTHFGGDAYVGFSQTGLTPDAGLANRLEVTDGATCNLRMIRVYPGGTLRTDGATVVVSNALSLYRGTRAEFANSTVSLAANSDMDFGGKGAEYADAEVCFSNSTVSASNILRMGGTNFVLRLYNSTATFDSMLQMSAYNPQGVFGGCALVFGGAAPQLTLPSVEWAPKAALRFEIPATGFTTAGPVMTATNTASNKGFMISGDGERRLEIVVDDDCPSGTYTLLKGYNCTSDKITIVPTYNSGRMKVSVVKTNDDADNIAILRVDVKQKKGLRLIFR